MGRTSRDRRSRPRPVERIELNEENTGIRLVLAIGMLILGAGFLAYAVMGFMSPNVGWQTIQAASSAGVTCAEEFTFSYEISSAAEAKALQALYTGACQTAFQMFSSDMEFDGVNNLCSINQHPNEVLEVEEALYGALARLAESGRRELYLGPVYERYDDLFFCQDDSQLADFDPRASEDVRREYDEILAYANDPRAVDLELLGEGRVRLKVSDAYLTWAGDAAASRFIDLAWMRNAFVADYLAGELAAEGYTRGSLSSYDGFTRNLDERDFTYAYPLYHRQGSTIYSAAEFQSAGRISLVRMRDYPLSDQDFVQYYELRNGEIRTMYLDTADALCRSAVDTLVCYSREKSCAEILLEMIPVYISDEFREEDAAALAGEGTESLYCQGSVIRYTEPGIHLENFFDKGGIRYTAEQIDLQ